MTRLIAILAVVCTTLPAFAKTIRVVVWDEQQPAQKQAYTNFLGDGQ